MRSTAIPGASAPRIDPNLVKSSNVIRKANRLGVLFAVKRIARLAAVSAVVAACSQDTNLKPFKSDGCSLFPDSSLITEQDWCSCCFEHDLAYWQGGTREQREDADTRLKACVFDKTQNSALAKLMYEGVRFGGSPYFLNWYRWGYGWSYDRKYQALTAEEMETAKAMVDEYFGSARGPACPG